MVVPAKVGTQYPPSGEILVAEGGYWMPAFAGKTKQRRVASRRA
jgi:hypothetical protein